MSTHTTDPAVDDIAAYDPEVFHTQSASKVLRLRGGERFIASETVAPLYEEMHRVLDDIVAEEEACEARRLLIEGVS